MRSSLFLATLLPLSIIATPLLHRDVTPDLNITSVAFSGAGCPTGSVDSSIDGQRNANVNFSKFVILATGSLSCTVTLSYTFTVPADGQAEFTIKSTAIGFGDMSPNTAYEAAISQTLSSNSKNSKSSSSVDTSGELIATSQIGAKYTGTVGSVQSSTATTALEVDLSGSGNGNGAASVDIESVTFNFT